MLWFACQMYKYSSTLCVFGSQVIISVLLLKKTWILHKILTHTKWAILNGRPYHILPNFGAILMQANLFISFTLQGEGYWNFMDSFR